MDAEKRPFATSLENAAPPLSSDRSMARSPSLSLPSRDLETDGYWPLEGHLTNASLSPTDSEHSSQSSVSCVTQGTSEGDCACHRFIVWAAVRRNSSKRMPAEKKLECPLLRCTRRFDSHELMLRHVAECEHLSSAEYWCYDHMRLERFDDARCGRCLGRPSRRRKMLNMAKTFFHSLGHKAKRDRPLQSNFSTASMVAPPSYESLERTNEAKQPYPFELSATEIAELDSSEVVKTEMVKTAPDACHSAVIDPQALQIPELDSTVHFSGSLDGWSLQESISDPAVVVDHPQAEYQTDTAPRPSLQISTAYCQKGRFTSRPNPRPVPLSSRSKGLSPSSSVRSNASATSYLTTTSNDSSLVSACSTWSGAWSVDSGFDTDLTVPVDQLGPADFLPADTCDRPSGLFDGPCPDAFHTPAPGLSADLAEFGTLGQISPQDLFMADLPACPIDANDIVMTDDSMPLLADGADGKQTTACRSETEALIESLLDTLREHVSSSLLKIQGPSKSSLAEQFCSMSIESIASTGIQSLRSLLNGGGPLTALDMICFIHVVYAFSLVVYEESATALSQGLFSRSRSYATSLPVDQQESYAHLISLIWQPSRKMNGVTNQIFTGELDVTTSWSSFPKGKEVVLKHPGQSCPASEDCLLETACNFLDEIECSVILGQTIPCIEVQTSDLYAKHFLNFDEASITSSTPFSDAADKAITLLCREFNKPDDLVSIFLELREQVTKGVVTTVRRFEIELLCAGRGRWNNLTYFGRFVPAVRRICDSLYQQYASYGLNHRSVYHSLTATLIKNALSESVANQSHKPTNVACTATQRNGVMSRLHADSGHVTDLSPMVPTLEGMGREEIEVTDAPRRVTSAPENNTRGLGAVSLGFSNDSVAHENKRKKLQEDEGNNSEHEQDHNEERTQEEKVESDLCCEFCSYRPKGSPRWFKGSLAKHMKLQHSIEPPKIYKCPYPGCTSQYKNRSDNLRQHQIEKGHFVDGEETSRRPSKRKKIADNGD
ncbi:hypothetical protein VTK73DRAFT_766 [Phialemonium thermophilum]|uniref:C2H2-type domain-containing protein n=1 Tax=Phialemonium thermophilum TaxID=223376 RepID=A0ABR3XCX9_9PEZI